MDRRIYEERRKVTSDFSLAIGEIWYGWGRRESDPVFAELQEAGRELSVGVETKYHFEWNIVSVDESHIYVTNLMNGHRYHVSVICPAALYVDVYCIQDDGTEYNAFAENE